jgi:hypothetical protein
MDQNLHASIYNIKTWSGEQDAEALIIREPWVHYETTHVTIADYNGNFNRGHNSYSELTPSAPSADHLSTHMPVFSRGKLNTAACQYDWLAWHKYQHATVKCSYRSGCSRRDPTLPSHENCDTFRQLNPRYGFKVDKHSQNNNTSTNSRHKEPQYFLWSYIYSKYFQNNY